MLEKMRLHYAIENPPTVYDEEAMTALELSGRVLGKVNEVVEEVNAQRETLTATIEDGIPAIIEEEVKESVRNGTFDRAIDQKYGNVEERLDNLLGQVQEGSTTMDAEIIDGRVDSSGAVYANIGESIRTQAKEAEASANRYFHVNRFNPEAITPGYINPETGAQVTSETYYMTDYIRIYPGETLRCFDQNMNEKMIRLVCLYDQTKTHIPTTDTFTEQYGYTHRDSEAFVRLGLRYTHGLPLMVCEGGAQTFVEYNEGVIRLDTLPDELSEVATGLVYRNLFDTSKACVGAYVNKATGLLDTTNPNYSSTPYLPVKPGQSISAFYNTMVKVNIRMYAVYDENTTFISGGENVENLTVPENGRYVRLSVATDFIANIMVAESACYRWLDYGETCVKRGALPSDLSGLTDNNPMLQTITGGHYVQKKWVSVNASRLEMTTFPNNLKKNVYASFTGRWVNFTSLKIGRGSSTVFGSRWVEISATKITMMGQGGSVVTLAEYDHGLDITNWLSVVFGCDDNGICYVTIQSETGTFTKNITPEYVATGVFFIDTNDIIYDVVFNVTCSDLSKPLWLVGDSYFGGTADRVVGQLINMGFRNYAVFGQPGGTSVLALTELEKALALSTPKTIVWYLGMNDGAEDEPYATQLALIQALCVEKGIELILNRVPTVPTIDKTAIDEIVVASGNRYIDSATAVNATSTGWSDGMLASDGVHPTELGAKALAFRLLADVPEVMSYREV